MFIVSMTVFVVYFFVKFKRYISICFRWILFREPVRYVYLTITLFPCRPTKGMQNERIRWIAAKTNNPRSVFSDSSQLHSTERAERRRHELSELNWISHIFLINIKILLKYILLNYIWKYYWRQVLLTSSINKSSKWVKRWNSIEQELGATMPEMFDAWRKSIFNRTIFA